MKEVYKSIHSQKPEFMRELFVYKDSTYLEEGNL